MLFAQEGEVVRVDTTSFEAASDSLRISMADSLKINHQEGTPSKNQLEDVVECLSMDSLIFDIESQSVFMYKGAKIDYLDIHIEADYVQIDFAKNIASARGLPDSSGKFVGMPLFKNNDLEFTSKEIAYNYRTEEGVIKDVRTEEGEGFLHGDVVKKLQDNTSNMGQGWYTTCSAKEPHFCLKYNKARVIPDDKVVTGLAWIEIEDVPLPVGLPFGLFPIAKGATSGIVIPRYGEQENRGFYLEEGGYYWHINDYMDLKVLGDIYTRGSWAVKPSFRYKLRYKFSGSFYFGYAVNKVGQPNTSSYRESRDFNIRWTHVQDPKARPNSSFNANVNFKSSNFNTFNPVSTTDYLSNTYQSSIAYQTKLFNKKGNLTLNAGLTQNTKSGSLNINLPSLSFSLQRLYPFKRKKATGKKRWYEDLSLQYNMAAQNTINTTDTLFMDYFRRGTLSQHFNNGIKHSVRIQSPMKILKYINVTNSFNYTDRWYFRSVRQKWVYDSLFSGTYDLSGHVQTDTVSGFVRGADYSIASSLSTKLYGMFNFKRGVLKAVRHVVTPSVSLSYTPDFGDEKHGYYKDYFDPTRGEFVTYSIFDGGNYSAIYGGVPAREQGLVSFNIGNNLEIKVRDRSDTLVGTRKVKIIDNFNLSTSYDMTRDSLRWNPLRLSGRTKLFNLINVTYAASYDPYALDSLGRRINTFQYAVDKRLFRPSSTSYQFSLSYSLSSNKLRSWREKRAERDKTRAALNSKLGTEEERMEIAENPEMFLDWDNPWNINIGYNLRLGAAYRYGRYGEVTKTPSYIHTISARGDVNITPKWKVAFNTNYDLAKMELSYTRFDIHRDLHCWEMSFQWTPMGYTKGWEFMIRAKSSLLQDLKLTRKKDFREY